jgi:hypothetical protein
MIPSLFIERKCGDKLMNDFALLHPGMFTMHSPPDRVVDDVLPNTIQGFSIADDMFVVVALPNPSVERCPAGLFYPISISFRGQGFEPMNYVW